MIALSMIAACRADNLTQSPILVLRRRARGEAAPEHGGRAAARRFLNCPRATVLFVVVVIFFVFLCFSLAFRDCSALQTSEFVFF